MHLIYYDWESQKIVYSFDKDEFDIEFCIPGLRVAYSNKINSYDYDWSSFMFSWSVNSVAHTTIHDNLKEKLELLKMKCCCVHDIIRICNIMKHRMKPEFIQFLDHDPFFELNNQNVDKQYTSYITQYMNPILSAKTYDDVKTLYQDFWVATKYIDDLVDVKINKYI
jgi:hypothetical protein